VLISARQLNSGGLQLTGNTQVMSTCDPKRKSSLEVALQPIAQCPTDAVR
jgi:hypothetical protein